MSDELDPMDELLDLVSPRFRAVRSSHEWQVVLRTPACPVPPTSEEFDTLVQSFGGLKEEEAKRKATALARALNSVLRM